MIRRLAFAAAFALAPLSAGHAADLCVSFTSQTFTGQKCGSVPEAAVPLFFAAYAGTYGTVQIPAVVGPDGKVTTFATTRPATQDEEFQAFAGGLAQGIADNVGAFARAQAAAAAAAQVPTIAITPQ